MIHQFDKELHIQYLLFFILASRVDGKNFEIEFKNINSTSVITILYNLNSKFLKDGRAVIAEKSVGRDTCRSKCSIRCGIRI